MFIFNTLSINVALPLLGLISYYAYRILYNYHEQYMFDYLFSLFHAFM
jgi:hypothetical protein